MGRITQPAADRTFIYAGSNLLLDAPEGTEEMFGLTGRVLDQAP